MAYLKKGVGAKRVKEGEEPTPELIAKGTKEMGKRMAKRGQREEETRLASIAMEKKRAQKALMDSLDTQLAYGGHFDSNAAKFGRDPDQTRKLAMQLFEKDPKRIVSLVRDAKAIRELKAGLTDPVEEPSASDELLDSLVRRYEAGREPGLGKGKKMTFQEFVKREMDTFRGMNTAEVDKEVRDKARTFKVGSEPLVQRATRMREARAREARNARMEAEFYTRLLEEMEGRMAA